MPEQNSVLAELKYFVTNFGNLYHGQIADQNKIVRCSINLLETLPTSREAVLEYFAVVFDVAVKNYVIFIDKEPHGSTPPDDETVNDIQEALDNLVTQGSPAWAPLISSWSLRILGSISHKHSRGRTMDIGSACTFWLGSSAMRGLLGLAASCFGKLNSLETEDCISTLLSTFVQNSPHFDWVVARLGGCFPLKVISKILQCGLKGFLGNFNNTLDSEVGILAYLSFAHENDLKFALNEMLQAVLCPNAQDVQPNVNTIPYFLHLCAMSEILLQPIVHIFLQMFNESIIPNLVQQSKLWPKNFNVHEIIPQLSTLVIKIKDNSIKTVLTLAQITEKYVWCQEFLEQILQELEYIVYDGRMCPLLTTLLTTLESKEIVWRALTSTCLIEQQTAIRLILLASHESPHIYRQTITHLLSMPFEDSSSIGFGSLVRLIDGAQCQQDFLQLKYGLEDAFEWITMRDNRTLNEDFQKDYNILKNIITVMHLEKSDAIKHLKKKVLTTSTLQCISKIIIIFSNYLNFIMRSIEFQDEYFYFMIFKQNDDGNGDESGDDNNNENENKIQNDDKKMNVDDNESDDNRNIDKPLAKKIKIDYLNRQNKKNNNNNQINNNNNNNIDDIKHLHFQNVCKQIHIIVDLLNITRIGENVPGCGKLEMADIIKLVQSSVKYFFFCLTEMNQLKQKIYLNRAYSLLARQCSHRKAACAAALRDLLNGSLFSYGHLFLSKSDLMEMTLANVGNDMKSINKEKNNLLIQLNRKIGPLSNTSRSALHAGIIGHGLKPPAQKIYEPDSRIKNLFLNAITACCESDDIPLTIDGFSTVSLLLVELISTDVMYNGLPWPDEEFTRVTMERDLQIYRTFKNTPILWAVLSLVAVHRPSLCFTSVLLRGIFASVLHQWRAKAVDKYQNVANNMDLYSITRRTLEILSMGQLLPAPLNHIHLIIEYLDPPEITIILKDCIWNYMKENVPAPALFSVDNTGLGWREGHEQRPPIKFIDPLRIIMQRKLPKLGAFYHFMFVLPEICEKTSKLVVDESVSNKK